MFIKRKEQRFSVSGKGVFLYYKQTNRNLKFKTGTFIQMFLAHLKGNYNSNSSLGNAILVFGVDWDINRKEKVGSVCVQVHW